MKKLLKQKQITQTEIKETTIEKPFPNLSTYTLKKVDHNKGKPSTIEIVNEVKVHNYWYNIFRRKRMRYEHFSEAVFWSESDIKIEYGELWRSRIS